ncbi:MAG: tetratricopeptide repeat protein [Bacteroidetes bacterium]|nr:tetratricopeptide repeat protein [Bacteroidota bacterium]
MKHLLVALIIIFTTLLPVAIHASGEDDLRQIDSMYRRSEKQEGIEKIETLLNLSEAYRLVSFDKSLKTGEHAMAFAEQAGYQGLKGKILKSLGVSAYYIGDYDLALQYYGRAIAAFKQVNDQKGIANCLHNTGLVYEVTGEMEKAVSFYEESLQIEEQLGDAIGQAQSIMNIGNLYYQQDSYDKALDYYFRALLITRDLSDTLLLGQLNQNIGLVYWQWDQVDEALNQFILARDLFEQSGELWEQANATYHIGLMYATEMNEPDKGLDYYLRALSMKDMVGDPPGSARILNSIGNLLAEQGKYVEAFTNYMQSLELYEAINNANGIVETYFYIGRTHYKAGNYLASIGFLEKCLSLARTYQLSSFYDDCNSLLMQNYEKTGNKAAFAHYFSLFNKAYDSTLSSLKKVQMTSARFRYKLNDISSDLSATEAKMDKLQRELQFYRWALAALILLVSSLFLVIFLMRKRNISHRKAGLQTDNQQQSSR